MGQAGGFGCVRAAPAQQGAAGPSRCLCGNLREGGQHGSEGRGGGVGSSPVSSQVGGKAGGEKEF